MRWDNIRNNIGWENVSGSSKVSPSPVGYSSWIEYYRDKTGCAGNKCCNANCSNTFFPTHGHVPEIVGAHVYQSGSSDESQYIVPLCKSCNSVGGYVSIKSGTVAVSANQSKEPDVIRII